MASLQRSLKWMIFLLIFVATLSSSTHAEEKKQSIPQVVNRFLNNTLQWRRIQQQLNEKTQGSRLKFRTPVVLAGVFCFVASSLSSAGGIGGGGLFLPILTVVVGLDLKTASSFSAFMVTGGSIPNVVSNMFFTSPKNGDKTLIDYDIALLSEPCMLLGVSIGVLCNLMFPEWLITIMFAVFLAWSTFKTFGAGVFHWKTESELMNRNGCQKLENGTNDESDAVLKEPLLHRETKFKFKLDIPWTKLGVLTMIWFSFLLLYLLRGNRYGRGIILIEACGIGYWIISATQIPLTIIFTSWILYRRESLQNQQIQSEVAGENRSQGPVKLIFPVMAFLAGSLGGVFGVGGGMLISPLLLQVGITPQVTAATCSFMVFFSSTMSAIQYVMLGMDNIAGAMGFSIICFSGSVIGLVILQAAIEKRGRASLIVFSVGLVLALSTVLMTSFGAVDVWRDYINGRYMGFKRPC